jgi:hypothetical protein
MAEQRIVDPEPSGTHTWTPPSQQPPPQHPAPKPGETVMYAVPKESVIFGLAKPNPEPQKPEPKPAPQPLPPPGVRRP